MLKTTMRRVLLSFAVVIGALVWPAAPATSQRLPDAPKVTEFEMSLSSPARAAAAGGSIVLPATRPRTRFDLVGLRWSDRGDVEVRMRVRRDGGRWSAWLDPGHAESGERGTPPMWTGGSDELQVKLSRRPHGLRAHFVDVQETKRFAARAAVAKRQVNGAPAMVMREQWDPDNECAPRSSSGIGEVKYAYVHHTVSSNLYAQADGPAMVLAICKYHRNSNGWNDVGYNFLVDRYGTIYEGRAGGIDKAVVGAQAQGFNSVSTGISNIGSFSSVGQTPEALAANAKLIAWKLGIHGVPVTGEVTVKSAGGASSKFPAGQMVTLQRISGHRDTGETECPGSALYAQLPEIRRLAETAPAGVPLGPVTPVPGTVSIDAPNHTIVFGQTAQVGGRAMTVNGKAISNAEVRVQVQTATKWQTTVKATTDGNGAWAAALPSSRTRRVRAVVYSAGARAATSSSFSLAVQPLIQAKAAKRVVAKRQLTVTGRVRPAKASLILEIAREGKDKKFHTVARIRVKARKGSFRVKTRLSRPALHRLRVTFRGDRTNAPTRSADLVLRAIRAKKTGGAQARTSRVRR
ncbi:MAG: N-acetylmuramoyl-L-alanine amidase [Solirubrobacteraceae bacterium]|nr:N-acetylmuramoyl-L-alanine amidase [Solirubrobacteraceae bacterium]